MMLSILLTPSLDCMFENCQAPYIEDTFIYHIERGIKASGSIHGEGLNVRGGEMVGVSYGIDWDIPVVKPSISIHDIHINAYVRCIRLVNTHQISIHDVHMYKTHVSATDWEGIDLTGCSHVQMHHLRFSTAGVIDTVSQATPIALVNCTNCTIDDCLAYGWVVNNSSFVLLANPATADNTISNLVISADSLSQFARFIGLVSSPGKNTIRGCVPDRNETMANGDTTPDVGNLAHPTLEYTGGAVTVTTFDNPSAGQEFTLFSNTGSAVLTLSNNATGTGCILKGGTNFTMPAGSCIHFKYHGGLWREMWRS